MSDLLYSDVEESLRESVRSALSRRLDSATVARLSDDPETDVSGVWRLLADDLGLAALLVPEQHGGAGAGPREAAVVLEELGRAVAPAPFLTSSVIATNALVAVDDGPSLASLAAGEVTAALVVPWTSRRGHWTVATGGCEPVAGALTADLFVVPVGVGAEMELRVLGRDEVDIESLTSLDMSRPLARVTATGEGRTIATGAAAREAVDAALSAGAALLASEQYGIARHCLETTVEYAKVRVQFARPIGSFQALKHRLADLYLEVVQAQAAARYAADTLASGDQDQWVAQALAQSYCSDVAVHAAEESLQLHGGIGMTWEHPVHLLLKRAKSDQLALGTPARHREDLSVLVDLVP